MVTCGISIFCGADFHNIFNRVMIKIWAGGVKTSLVEGNVNRIYGCNGLTFNFPLSEKYPPKFQSGFSLVQIRKMGNLT